MEGNIVDIKRKEIYPGIIRVTGGKIERIERLATGTFDRFIIPGFIDSHVHIESSMLVPSEFARLAVVHGTVGTVSDPHEIANVCGVEGVEYMIENGKTVPFKFNFGAPSCVPATPFETAGAVLGVEDVRKLLEKEEIKYLSEMMNFPGVLSKEPEVMQKIKAAHDLEKPVDGHAPGLRGKEAQIYAETLSQPRAKDNGRGQATDHECFTIEEARDKLQYGMKILIREGSAAKNFDALIGLLNDYPDSIMFCSDDKHPDSLVEGHIDRLCARAVAKGIDIYKVLQAACVNPVEHYGLGVGLLETGDAADLIVVKDLVQFEVLKTYINGQLVAENGQSLIESKPAAIINNFSCLPKSAQDFAVSAPATPTIPVIEALDGQLITNKISVIPLVEKGCIVSDPDNDILKIAVINRYTDAPVATAFIKNFGLKSGAIASSVAHDSHNIVIVGVDDESMAAAANLIIGARGGISVVNGKDKVLLALPVGGLMSVENGYEVAKQYSEIDILAKKAGSRLQSPFMTLSFMALLVIPALKLSDKGLFDGVKFELL